MPKLRDHGGGLDAAAATFGGQRSDWIDLSTGINPVAYPIPGLPAECWAALPDTAATAALIDHARAFWKVPKALGVLCTPGLSSAIALIPHLTAPGSVVIQEPTYNEHAASFAAAGWTVTSEPRDANVSVFVHPNNPDGHLWSGDALSGDLQIVDESFCDTIPHASLLEEGMPPEALILKSFGKFWGLAGLRLGFVIGQQDLLDRLAERLGPWPVSGPALAIGIRALADQDWAETTRVRLAEDANRMDTFMTRAGAQSAGGTTLFRLYDVDDAKAWQARLAAHRIWTRVFPYNARWLRLGLPGPADWDRLDGALA